MVLRARIQDRFFFPVCFASFPSFAKEVGLCNLINCSHYRPTDRQTYRLLPMGMCAEAEHAERVVAVSSGCSTQKPSG